MQSKNLSSSFQPLFKPKQNETKQKDFNLPSGKDKFTLEGRSYDLAVNNGPNHLHGGLKGLDKCVWDAEAALGVEGTTLGLSLVSPDGDQG